METVGQATWSHSLKALKPGGAIVVSGATSGANPPADLNRVFFLQLRVLGSTMGTKAELAGLISFLHTTGLRPLIDRELPLESAADGLAAMASGDLVGKIVLTV
jgi:D-arabinose 1-dehydrogenase-like Zn-dependent alcohol dehydrogenase